MEIIYLLIPISLVLIGLILWAFFWAAKSGQFEDLEGPAYEILMDNDNPTLPQATPPQSSSTKN